MKTCFSIHTMNFQMKVLMVALLFLLVISSIISSCSNAPATDSSQADTLVSAPPVMLAFEAWKHGAGGKRDIFLMHADGSNVKNLTVNPADDTEVSWSPDGGKIVFSSNRDEKNYELYTMDIATGNTERLTNNTVTDAMPSWSADGQYIAYTAASENQKEWNIYVLHLSDKSIHPFTSAKGYCAQPAWSPDGKYIAFIHKPDTSRENSDIYIETYPVLSGWKKLTSWKGTDFCPAWHPSSEKIAYMSIRDNNENLYELEINTGNIKQLTDASSSEDMPSWSPDGKQLAFMRAQWGEGWETHSIWMKDADSAGIKPLYADTSYNSINPKWRPVGYPLKSQNTSIK